MACTPMVEPGHSGLVKLLPHIYNAGGITYHSVRAHVCWNHALRYRGVSLYENTLL